MHRVVFFLLGVVVVWVFVLDLFYCVISNSFLWSSSSVWLVASNAWVTALIKLSSRGSFRESSCAKTCVAIWTWIRALNKWSRRWLSAGNFSISWLKLDSLALFWLRHKVSLCLLLNFLSIAFKLLFTDNLHAWLFGSRYFDSIFFIILGYDRRLFLRWVLRRWCLFISSSRGYSEITLLLLFFLITFRFLLRYLYLRLKVLGVCFKSTLLLVFRNSFSLWP